MKRSKPFSWLLAALLAVVSVAVSTYYDRLFPTKLPEADGVLTAIFVDTGNSDSTVVHFPDGRTMLIDAGRSDDFENIRRALNKFDEDTIDYAVISHPHDDHIGAFPDILKHYKVNSVYMPQSDIENEALEESLELIEAQEIPLIRAKAGVNVCDDTVTAKFLSPLYDHYKEENDYSAVLHLIYGEKSMLFMGDATTAVENDLLKKGSVPDVDVLKVGHHGSKTSTGKNFLNAALPEYAVILADENQNSYGHPTPAWKKLRSFQIPTYRSDYDGDITVTTDGHQLGISGE